MVKRKKVITNDTIEKKLEYIGLNLKNIPPNLKKAHKINFRPIKNYDEKQYKQYRFLNVNDIEILLTPTNRLDSLKDRYEKAKPLYMYLDSKSEDSSRYMTFRDMLKKVEISDIEGVEKEQELLAKKLPFKIRYNRNYLWQIYYSESTDRYFMLVPTKDTEYSTLFYLIKKKLEYKKDEKIFVPISYVDYESNILKKTELKDLENYLWIFTKDYPSIYEIYDKKGNPTLQIIGESQVYGKIKTLYKIVFETPKEAIKFYKLLKALFILQTELPHYYNFTVNIEDDNEFCIYLENSKIKYENLPEFVLEQYMKSISLKQNTKKEIEKYEIKLQNLKNETETLESEYLIKEKQISTFLECKKSFFGKVKYYFKLGKKSEKNRNNQKEENKIKPNENQNETDFEDKKGFKLENRRYTLDELVRSFKELEILENKQKNIVMDINAIKLTNKNLKKKIENATSYINEINEHKKSIFEFWKYSNKDEVVALEEGEEEECNVTKIEKIFNIDEDFENFGISIDKNQRMKFTDSELDSSYIASTELIDLINKEYKKEADPKDFSAILKTLKEERKIDPDEDDEFDVFGTISDNNNKERTLGSKCHREAPRNKYEILNIRKGCKGIELKRSIDAILTDIKQAMKKNVLEEELYVYKAMSDELDVKELQVFSLNEANEINTYLEANKLKKKNNLYRIKLPKGTNFIGLSNIIYYNNQSETLPVGMDGSASILIDLSELNLKEVNTKEIGKVYLENNKNDFSKVIMKNITIHELESIDSELK